MSTDNVLQVYFTARESVLSRCIVCHEETEAAATKSLLLTLLKCLTADNYDDDCTKTDEEKVIVVCSKCQKYLTEWHDLMNSVSVALQQARQIKCTLIASIICCHQNRSKDFDSQLGAIDLKDSSVLKDFNVVKAEIFKEYNAKVMLEKVKIPSQQNQNESAVPCEVDTEENYEPEIEIYSDSKFQKNYNSDSSSSSDDDVKSSGQRLCPTRKKLKVNTSAPNQKWVEIGPNEFLYAGKFKIEFEDNFYNCPVCPKKFDSKAKIMGHVRYKHNSAREIGFKKQAGHCKLLPWERIGPDQFVYAEKFKFRYKNQNQYQCDTCEAIYNSRPGMFSHIRHTHLRGVKISKDVRNPSRSSGPSAISQVSKRGRKCTDQKSSRKPNDDAIADPSYPAEFVQPVENNPDQFLYFGKYTVTLVDGKLVCPVCQLERQKHKYMLNHIKARHHNRSLARSIKETAPGEFLYHEKYPFKFIESDNVYECGICELRSETMKGIMPHIRATHYTAQDKQQFSAVQISETEYLYAGKYKINYRDGRYYCSLCDFSRFTVSDLYLHYRISHKGKEISSESIKVPPDEASSSNEEDKNTAKNDTTDGITQAEYRGIPYTFNSVLRKYKCGDCGTHLNSRNYLQQHIRTHLVQTRDFICEVCGDSFLTDQHLRQHRKRHGGAKFSCKYCPKSFKSRSVFKYHVAIHEKGEDAKQFQCEHCGKKFAEKAYLANHVRLHTGEKPHKCIICAECFTDSGRLFYHRKSVHGIERQRKILD